jgi:triacylglycerol lipase
MSGQFNILPLNPPNPQGPGGNFAGTGSTCNGPGQGVSLGIIKGPSAAASAAPAGGGGGRGAAPDAATQLARSSLPELEKTKVALLFANAELDPGISGAMSPFFQALHDELCKVGPGHCPTMLFEKGESHMSEVFSIDTPDVTVSKPILEWIKKVK